MDNQIKSSYQGSSSPLPTHVSQASASKRQERAAESRRSIGQIALSALRQFVKCILHLARELVQLFKIITVRRDSRETSPRDEHCPIAFIHGLAGRKSNWNCALNQLEERGAAQLGQFHPISLRLANITLQDDVAQAVNELVALSKTNEKKSLMILGHSRGGLVALLAAQKLRCEHDIDIRGVVTIASPLKGSHWANRGNKYLGFCKFSAFQELAVGSASLDKIAQIGLSGKFPVLHLVAKNDILVQPECAQLNGNSVVSIDTGHMGILVDPKSIEVIFEWLTNTV